MRKLSGSAVLVLLALSAVAQPAPLTRGQAKLYNRLPDADWFILHLSEKQMIAVSLKRTPVKQDAVYRDVWIRWDLVRFEGENPVSTGLVVDIDCANRRTLEKKEIIFDTARKREVVRQSNQLHDWLPDTVTTSSYEIFCAGFDRALVEWKNRPAPQPAAKPEIE